MIEGYWDIKQLADYHGVDPKIAAQWCRRDNLPSEQIGRKGPRLIKIEDAKAFTPSGRRGYQPPTPPEGYWGTSQIIVHCRVSRQAVWNWYRCGKLHGIKPGNGLHAPTFALIEDVEQLQRERIAKGR